LKLITIFAFKKRSVCEELNNKSMKRFIDEYNTFIKNNSISFTIIILFVILIIVFSKTVLLALSFIISKYLVLDSNISNEHRLQIISLLFLLIGGVWAYLSYYKLRKKEQSDFVELEIKTELDDINKVIYIRTSISNKVNTKKYIKCAFLIITEKELVPDTDIFLKTVGDKMGFKFNFTNEFALLEKFNQKYDTNFMFIPLKYYYEENIRFGNEKPTYTHIIDNSIKYLKDGIYDVRFFVFSKTKNELHRCVHDAIIINNLKQPI
jgi:hypothetical protein